MWEDPIDLGPFVGDCPSKKNIDIWGSKKGPLISDLQEQAGPSFRLRREQHAGDPGPLSTN